MIASSPLLSKRVTQFFSGGGKMCFLSLRGGRTPREKDFQIKLTTFRSPKTQYYCDQILSKTDQYT